MEQTLTESGALFAAQHKRGRKTRQPTGPLQTDAPARALCTFRASVGDFSVRPVQFGCRLEIKVGKVRQLLGVYETIDAAVLALRNRNTHFYPWDAMGRNAVEIQVGTTERWEHTEPRP